MIVSFAAAAPCSLDGSKWGEVMKCFTGVVCTLGMMLRYDVLQMHLLLALNHTKWGPRLTCVF